MSFLYHTKIIPDDAVILMIDPDSYFIEEAIENLEEEEAMIVRNNLYAHASQIVQYVTLLKSKGYQVASTPAHSYWKGFESLIDITLPGWEVHNHNGLGLHPAYYDFAKGKKLIIGGMWREICVFEVAHRLQSEFGQHVQLCSNDLLSISYEETYVAPEFDMFNLTQACADYRLSMKLCG